MVVMVKRRYQLSGISVIAEDKCTNTAHHIVDINVELTRVGRHVQSAAWCFKASPWLDT